MTSSELRSSEAMWFLRGILSGLAGAFAMQQFRSTWNTRVAVTARDGVFGLDDEADINAVNLVVKRLGKRGFEKEAALRIALLMHYGYGASAGVLYEWMAKKFPSATAGYGLTFGVLLWLIGDEGLMDLAGIAKVKDKSGVSHASALAAHLLFAAVLEAAREQGA